MMTLLDYIGPKHDDKTLVSSIDFHEPVKTRQPGYDLHPFHHTEINTILTYYGCELVDLLKIRWPNINDL